MPVVYARGVSKTYRDGEQLVSVLDGLDLQVEAGSSLAVTGPSGSGKSTLLNLVAGVIQVDQGELSVDCRGTRYQLDRMSERERTAYRRCNVGYVFQFFNLIPTLTVGENVELPLQLNRRAELKTHARELLALFGLGDRVDAYPASLSGGEQQRVAVARALAMRPPIVLADEPTGNLDAENAAIVADLLFRHASQVGAMLMVATHSRAVAGLAQHELKLNARD